STPTSHSALRRFLPSLRRRLLRVTALPRRCDMTFRLQGARLAVLAAAVAAVVAQGWKTSAQAPAAPRATTAAEAIVANSYPNPFVTTADFFKMPAGRKWGSTAGVDID